MADHAQPDGDSLQEMVTSMSYATTHELTFAAVQGLVEHGDTTPATAIEDLRGWLVQVGHNYGVVDQVTQAATTTTSYFSHYCNSSRC